VGTSVRVTSGTVNNILVDASTTTTGNWIYKAAPKAAIQATVAGTGAVTATVQIEASNDGINPLTTLVGSITLSGTTSTSDGFTTDSPWKYIRAKVTAISGTSALVDVIMGL